ncbi:hypothetical protein fugu_009441 [Takifugu bimaculatus]|uniref:Solute carrier family 35 member F2 n=1 Tax=Takifugu bimaculatus TaxID=433685 RepID=A0A4Z2AYN0_9TELE|nr:hypothetical protein fugu_009441 [Takifugu bimaculatus]
MCCCCSFTRPVLSTRKDDQNIIQILRTKWWKYLIMGVADVEANYTVVKAYQFTSLTSIQLLDCFVIPALMVLSWFILKTRYRPVHFVAVLVCLLGVGTMVGADVLAGRDQGSTHDVILGDGFGPAQCRTLRHLQRVPGAHGEEPEPGGVPGHDGIVWDSHQWHPASCC